MAHSGFCKCGVMITKESGPIGGWIGKGSQLKC